ncbi:hypothetical protein NS183_01825 [Microbacterium testaceum]|nr:hypothetical protein NS183_01825 [Microbacterium testaceum]
MGHREVAAMKARLLRADVTTLERLVLLDMAAALADGSTIYSWGHDRLALAIGKEPGSKAAKSALSVRVLPSLIDKGLLKLRSAAHRSRRAEYDVLVLAEMGTDQPVDKSGMGTGSKPEWVPVSGAMGSGQTDTPATLPAPIPAPGSEEHPNHHRHEPNALAALTRLASERRLPLTIDELLRIAYSIGHGDPWDGYLIVKSATEAAIGDARDPRALLLSRFRQLGMPMGLLSTRRAT